MQFLLAYWAVGLVIVQLTLWRMSQDCDDDPEARVILDQIQNVPLLLIGVPVTLALVWPLIVPNLIASFVWPKGRKHE